jgi:hypothetical protein
VIPNPVFTSINLRVDGKVRHYRMARGVYALVPMATPNEPMDVETFEAAVPLVSERGIFDFTEAVKSGLMHATDAIPGVTLGTPIGFCGCIIAFDDNGELIL